MSSIFSKTPPFSDEAEKSVLGCMILDKDAIITALHLLVEDDFFMSTKTNGSSQRSSRSACVVLRWIP